MKAGGRYEHRGEREEEPRGRGALGPVGGQDLTTPLVILGPWDIFFFYLLSFFFLTPAAPFIFFFSSFLRLGLLIELAQIRVESAPLSLITFFFIIIFF